MPGSSPFTINNFSPDFRDALLNRNLLVDTVTNNSLSSWLDSINKIPSIGDGVGIIKGSEDIEIDGVLYRESNVIFSKINKDEYYTGIGIDYSSVDVDYGIVSTGPISSPTNDSDFWRDENTVFNIFNEGNPEYYGNSVIDYSNTNVVTNTDYINNSLFSAQNSPENDASFRRELNITQNQYKADIYEKVSLDLLPFEVDLALATLDLDPNTYSPSLEAYTLKSVPENGPFQGGNIRQFNTSKNMYLDVDKQTRVDLNTQPMATVQYKSYLDENGNLNFGDTGSVQLVDAIGSVLTGGGIGLDPNSGSIVPDFDVRSSLAGRLLTSAGALDDTRLGQISPQYLGMAIGNNIAFNLQEETLGRINTNPLSLAMGGSLIVPNNKITVKDGPLGFGADILERMTGAKIPVSLLPKEADIFSYDTKGYIGGGGNIQRANAILKNTGKGTVSYLLGNVKASINTNFTGNRQGYAPAFDGGGNDKISDSEAKLYALYDGEKSGFVKDILSQTKENTPVPQSSYDLEGMVRNSGFNQGPATIFNHHVETIDNTPPLFSKFTWSDKLYNKLARISDTALNGTDFTEPKTILFKTQELFNSGKMRTLVSGKGVKANIPVGELDEITSTYEIAGQRYMSKGSAVFKNGGRDLNKDSTPDNMFARAWSTVDAYNSYDDLQKHSALSPDGRVDRNLNIESSVLRDPGVVQIGPYKGEKIKRFMFSLENLAWSDSLTKLMPCEKGPGDPLTGRSGRIMWFPPYDIAINESVSASYDRTNFIGRGEPIYTYNNTERSGTLSWKIVVDHPNYINFFRDGTDMDYASFFAGAMSVEEIRNRVLSDEEKDKYEIAEANKDINGVPKQVKPKFEFNIYYPNDNSEVPYYDSSVIVTGSNINSYESGRDYDGNFIDYGQHPSGIVYDTVEVDGVINATTGFTTVYGMKTTTRDGGKTDIDNTNFGLNGTSNSIKLSMSDIEELDGWYGFEDLRTGDDLDNYFISKEGNCRYCRFTIKGYASPQGNFEANKILAKKRGDNLKQHIIDTIGVDEKRITVLKAEAIQQSGCKQDSSKDIIECKEDRKVTVSVAYDSKLEKDANPNPTKRDPNEPDPKFTIPLSRFYTECNYFESIKETDNFVYAQFKDKIKNFHPAFHAITPEGFNSRLTFLQQCMRQGPTNGSDSPDNLAFGKPPVCILRLGDFYHTKIIIESLTIDYEPIVWDLNPEGIGVQPMIANINISFAFIGGSSMKGPINRLQNAISFNYFANTELYDPRAERIVDGEIQEGNFPFSKDVTDRLAAEKKDQEEVLAFEKKKLAEEEAQKANIKEEEAFLKALANDQEILKAISISEYNNPSTFDTGSAAPVLDDSGKQIPSFGDIPFYLRIEVTNNDKITDTGLQREYYGQLFIKNAQNNSKRTIGFLTAKPINDTSFLIESRSFTEGDNKSSEPPLTKEDQEAIFEIVAPPDLPTIPATLGSFYFENGANRHFIENAELLNPCTITVFEDIGNLEIGGQTEGTKSTAQETRDALTRAAGGATDEEKKATASELNKRMAELRGDNMVNIKQSTRPCPGGEHQLVLEWKDKQGFKTSSRVIYNKETNNKIFN